MQIQRLLSWRNAALLASFAVIGIGGGGYLLVGDQPDGYSCDSVLMPKEQARAYLQARAAGETLGSSTTCTPQWIRTPSKITSSSAAAAAEEEEEEEEAEATDRPDEAIRFRNLSLRDENGVIAVDGLVKAAEHVAAMRAAAPSLDSTMQISKTSWKWLGPGNVGGRTRALVISPANPNVIWLGSVGGGIWKTTNGGTSWAPQNDFLANLAVSSLIIDPNNSNVLYAGTGEGFFNSDAIRGAGIFKTTDGGTHWTQLATTKNDNFLYVNRLAISQLGKRVLAATRTGIFRSTAGGTWYQSASPAEEILDIKTDPTNDLRAVAGGRNGKAWWSSNGGSTWTAATGLPTFGGFDGRVELAYAKSNSLVVFASVDTGGSASGALYRSNNGGHSFTLVNNVAHYLGGQGWYDNVVWVDPTNAARVVVGGVDLWRSSNSGATLTKISDWVQWYSGLSAHADQHAIVGHPGYNGTSNLTVYIGDDGGIYRAANILTATTTSGWQELNNNLGITQFYSAAGNPTTGEIIAGAQDNGSQFFTKATGPQGWHLTDGGDGGFSAADPIDPNYFYDEYVYLTISRSSNRGDFGQTIYSGLGDANSCAYFIAPFILDPNNANRLFAGGCRLWRTDNAKVAGQPTWTAISPQLSPGNAVSAVAVLKGNSNVVWIGFGNGDIYRTANALAASPSWTKVDDNAPGLPNRYAQRIAIASANVAYVTFGGFSPDNVWRTGNNGASWQDRTGSGATGLPDAPVRSILVHPAHPTWLYAGTEVGVFASQDEGATWTVPQSGPANVSVDELAFLNSALIAATHGRGVYQSETEPCVALTTNVNVAGRGTVTKSAGNCVTSAATYSPLSLVTVRATAKPGFVFSHWSGASTSTVSVIRLKMTAATSVTANFVPATESESPQASAEPTATVN